MTDRTETVPTGAHWGIYDVLVADGRVVGARPWDEDPDPAPLYAALPETVDHPTRIDRRRPMVRAGYHNAGPSSDTAGRGAEPFVPVSWERALHLVAGELGRVRREHGGEAIFAGTGAWWGRGWDPDPAPLYAALPETVDHPTRIDRPMVRAGYHNAGPAGRARARSTTRAR